MINKFKQFEETAYEEALRLSQIKRNKSYVVIDMERGVIEGVTIFGDEESAYNFVRNFVYENFEAHGYLEDIGDETDPYQLIIDFNDRWCPELEIYLEEAEFSPPVKLDKSIELRMTTKKYNI